MEPYPVYVLNLDRNPERLESIERRLDALGIEWTRQCAIDGQSASEEELAQYSTPMGPIFGMGNGTRACTAGHFLIWSRFLQTGAAAAIVLEDDVEISGELVQYTRIPPERLKDVDILKLECHSIRHTDKRLVVGSRVFDFGQDLYARRLLSVHYGTGGYLVTRKGAEALLKENKPTNVPIDHLLFNPNDSQFACSPGILQAIPAVVRQQREKFTSEIGGSSRRSGTISGRLKRLYYEVNQIPKLLLMLAAQRARIVEIHCDLAAEKDRI